ncbi:phage portal protein, pbsx family [Klebsiella pneumoniae]|nr:phage portal protein, pbsx family [Klebsiella pneumoniae]
MSKRKNKNNRAAVDHNPNSGGAAAEAFSFGDPVPVLDRRELLDYVECVQMDRWYEPPVSFDGLARTYRAAVHHSSPIAVKRDILSSTYIPHRLLSQQAFARFVQDYLVFGNAYLEKRTNRLGSVLSLEPALAKYTRRGVDLDTYWFVQYGMTTQPYEFTQGNIFHLLEPDINQEIYGLPGYLSAIPSTLLNESATLFRPEVLHQRQPRGFHHVHDRRSTESGGREQYPPGNEKRQRAGQLPQPVYVFAQR